mgnify:CR=1 FL=1
MDPVTISFYDSNGQPLPISYFFELTGKVKKSDSEMSQKKSKNKQTARGKAFDRAQKENLAGFALAMANHYLNPFTNESQVNYKLPMYSFPNVICHEMAHQIGYASESECNFIGFMACIKNDDLYFQYAAHTVALRYCLKNVMMKNEVRFKALKTTINPGIIENYKETELFWEQYDTFIDKGFHAFYDQFLKVNQQKDGLESYSKFVDLLINYYKGKELR